MTRLYLMGGIAAAVIALSGVTYWQFKRAEGLAHKLDQCRAAASTLERINESLSLPLSNDDVDDRLRDLSQ